MPDRVLPDRPNLEQYRKQAKTLRRATAAGDSRALERIRKHHSRFAVGRSDAMSSVSLADAQFVLAREHGYESWAEFARHIETLRMIRTLWDLRDPVSTFIELACVDRHGPHASGTIEYADIVRNRHPEVAAANIYCAAVLGDAAAVRTWLATDSSLAAAKGGPHGWDALTYLCFSKYLRIDKPGSESFVAAARALLEAGADANTGWIEYIDDPRRPIREPVIYGAAALAQHADLTRVLLEYGADPNDEETPYHLPETGDNTVMRILLESRRFNETSLACLALRKADWHDIDGLRLALEYGANPNLLTRFPYNALQQAIRRDNDVATIELLLDYRGDPYLANAQDGQNAIVMAARRGRGDILDLLRRRGITFDLSPLDAMIAACAEGNLAGVRKLDAMHLEMKEELFATGGRLLCDFAGNGNLEGLRCLFEAGIAPESTRGESDPYWDLTKETTALHNAAWRMHHDVVRQLITTGVPVNALDSKGRSALALAVKACTNSYWMRNRKPDSVAALLAAGARTDDIELPTGFGEIDNLLIPAKEAQIGT